MAVDSAIHLRAHEVTGPNAHMGGMMEIGHPVGTDPEHKRQHK